MEQLREVDVTGVEAMTSVTPMALPLRPDIVTAHDIRERILAGAQDANANFFAVPKVVE